MASRFVSAAFNKDVKIKDNNGEKKTILFGIAAAVSLLGFYIDINIHWLFILILAVVFTSYSVLYLFNEQT